MKDMNSTHDQPAGNGNGDGKPTGKAKRGPGDPKRGAMPRKFSNLEQDKFIDLLGSGLGRVLACEQMGQDYRIFQRSYRMNRRFAARVRAAESRNLEQMRLVIYGLATNPLEAFEGEPAASLELRLKAATAFLNHRLKVKAMVEAKQDRKSRERSSGKLADAIRWPTKFTTELGDQAARELAEWRANQAAEMTAWHEHHNRMAGIDHGGGPDRN